MISLIVWLLAVPWPLFSLLVAAGLAPDIALYYEQLNVMKKWLDKYR